MPTFTLIAWPMVALVFFLVLGRQRGLIWSVVVGYLFLPEVWTLDIQGLPSYAKAEAIALGLVLGVTLTQSDAGPPPKADPFAKRMFNIILVLLFLSSFLTMLTNRDPVFIGDNGFVLPGIGLWELQNRIVGLLVALTPFFLARRYLFNPKLHREFLKAMLIMGLVYAMLALYEVRMSPVLNSIVYGYFPHDWTQHLRNGFRPVVFLSHGLELGFFLLTAVLAGIGLARASGREIRSAVLVGTIVLFLILAISRNFGALAICLLFAPIALFLSPKFQVKIAVIVSILFVAYPLTRNAYIQPLLYLTEMVSGDRFRSLQFRFINEDMLLERASERPLTGWGPWGRWFVYNDNGEAISVPDGIWIIQLGAWGWMGFIGLFGLLIAPIFLMKRAGRLRSHETLTSVIVLMVAANLIYMIPNSTLSPVGFLVAGALAGYVQFTRDCSLSETDTTSTTPGNRRRLRYTRFKQKHGFDRDG